MLPCQLQEKLHVGRPPATAPRHHKLGPSCLQEKLRRRVNSVEVKVLHPPRRGKKCLVLDIDYTIFDLGSSAERPHELARPYLHQFLAAVWEHFDIVIWSATNMKWVGRGDWQGASSSWWKGTAAVAACGLMLARPCLQILLVVSAWEE